MKNKLVTLNNLSELMSDLKLRKLDVVFTNGCFDIIHPGHIHILEKAKSYGDVLIVGLNSNGSVKNLKGKSRPINSESDRIKILCSIKHVDHVIVFDEDTPIEAIKNNGPDIIVKGGDYTVATTVGNELADVKIFPTVQGFSTSNIVDKVNKK